jgi:alpha-mannosidase
MEVVRMLLTVEKLERRVKELSPFRYTNRQEIGQFLFWKDEAAEVAAMPPQDAEWTEVGLGYRWGDRDVTAWLKTEVLLPEQRGCNIVGLFNFGKTGPGHTSGFESLLFINGTPFQGVGTFHQEVFFPEELAGQRVELLFKVWSGLPGFGPLSELRHILQQAELTLLQQQTDDLYFTASAAMETIKVLDSNSWERHALVKAVDRAFLLVDYRNPGSAAFYESVTAAAVKLHEEIESIPKNNEVTVRAIGHTHIDVAWLWRLKHTREKSARSFSTVLRLMERYPEYAFLQTQPQLYDDLSRDYPVLFEQIKKRVKEGRWEAGGAMWLESDCNIPNGESLVRQLMYGMRYYEQTFGVSCDYLWLPDVFGYSWALPQILKKSGINYFMTTKISWNVYNRFPHDTFYWRGIDGTEVLTHYITTPEPGQAADSLTKYYTYNGQVLAETVNGIWKNYRDKEVNDELLLAYGWGDGGGGPTRHMLEMRRRLEHMPGLPRVTTGRVDEYFHQLEHTVDKSDRYVHRWNGELYLELHRGTYTSQGYVKRMNREMESLLHTAEAAGVLHGIVSGFKDYPKDTLDESWKIVLRNQFHDILPGSSIAEVYEDCHVEYGEAERLAREALGTSLSGLAGRLPLAPAGEQCWIVVNSLGMARDELVELAWQEDFAIGGSWTDADGNHLTAEAIVKESGERSVLVRIPNIPAFGYKTISYSSTVESAVSVAEPSIIVKEQGLSTPFYELTWNSHGQLDRLYDKRTERELIAPGEAANRFDVHEDKPTAHDNWEIDIFYYEKHRQINGLQSVVIAENNPLRTVVRMAWQDGETALKQDMIVYTDNPRIDFVTWVNWQEREQLLKVAFPLNVSSTYATHEIQFGNVRRPTHWNTSWDFAQFETCAQRWIDLSERGCGVSLLNNCKYGHDVRDNVMRLTLIKSSNDPDPTCDLGEHVFTYSLLPHDGDWFEAGTLEQAARLNTKPETLKLSNLSQGSAEAIPLTFGLIAIEGGHVVVDTVKRAEDSDALIVRCYEYAGMRGNVSLRFNASVAEVAEVNLMEREAREIAHQSNQFAVHFTPYELKTFRVVLS